MDQNGRRTTKGCKLEELTTHQLQILAGIAAGNSDQQIADKLNLSTHGLRKEIDKIFKKIGVSSRLQATFWAVKNL